MDTENEVVPVDDVNVATNGLNGHSEDLGEMKTRSKTSEADVVKSKVRSARNVSGQDKAGGSDTEKKDKKVAESKQPATKEVTGGSGGGANVAAKKSGAAAAAATTTTTTTTTTKVNEVEQPVVVVLPVKKRNNADRGGEEDSGINSRASSVSNDDATPRMRTRSSRSSEIASTSTPAKKGQGRMPLSTYDFEDVTFDEDEVLPPSSLKRKAVMIVEEMDEEMDEEERTESGEPAAKRRPVFVVTANFFSSIFSPFRALRGKFTSSKASQPAPPATVNDTSAPAKETTTATTTTTPSSEEGSADVDTVDAVSKENAAAISQPESSEAANSESPDMSQTCRIM